MKTAERISRHWYDLYELSKGSIGQAALNDIDLLADVVLYKNTFYYAGYAKYDECLIGKLNLIPHSAGITQRKVGHAPMSSVASKGSTTIKSLSEIRVTDQPDQTLINAVQ